MSSKLSWGILGTGAIAHALARALSNSRTGQLTAVASRTSETADSFGDELQIPPGKRYAAYDRILSDPQVQAVYIAIPHPLHAQWAIKAIRAGKHVLIEKPIAVNQYEAQAIFEAAHDQNVFVMEAFMYRCHPQTAKIIELLQQRTIGQLQVIQATFSFHASFNPQSRLYKNALAGGGILDIGCYPASLARLLAGAVVGKDFADPLEVKAVGHLEETGIDGYTLAVLRFPPDILAQIAGGVAVNQENVLRLFGSEGKIFVPDPWVANRTSAQNGRIIVHRQNQEPEEIDVPADVTSFTLEVDYFGDSVAAGRRQAASPAMSWDDSLGNMATLDAWRQQIGVEYEFEKPPGYPKTTVVDEPLSFGAKNRIPAAPMPHLDKKVSRLVMGVDNQRTMPHAAVMFDAFFEYGGNAFDTAFIYGGGVNEQVLGHWMKNRNVRRDVVLICKGAHTPECTPAAIGRQLTRSLERLQTDHGELYLLHRDNPEVPVGEFVDALNREHSAGRIGAFGGSNWSIERIEAANQYAAKNGLRGFSILSNNFSLAQMLDPIWAGCVSASDAASRAWLEKTPMPLLAWSSQARGFFTDRAHADRSLNDDEMNRVWHSPENWRRRERVIELAAKKNVLPINVALAYVLCQPFPTFALIGPRTLAELRTSLAGAEIQLSAKELRWLNLEDG